MTTSETALAQARHARLEELRSRFVRILRVVFDRGGTDRLTPDEAEELLAVSEGLGIKPTALDSDIARMRGMVPSLNELTAAQDALKGHQPMADLEAGAAAAWRVYERAEREAEAKWLDAKELVGLRKAAEDRLATANSSIQAIIGGMSNIDSCRVAQELHAIVAAK